MTNNTDVLKIQGLKKRFGDKDVLRGVDLSVSGGSIFGFIGKNGSGKTTTMKAVLGLLSPDSGEISVCGEKVTFGETKTNRYVGYLPDVPEFYSFLTAREYLRLCGECCGMTGSEIKSRSDELLTLVGLSDEKHRIKGYSRGMKQRLGIAQALIARPRLLICDEPTSALDPIGRKEILDILLSVKDETTVLFSTHILSDVERICTDVAFLANGVIAMHGTVSELKSMHRTESFTIDAADRTAAEVLASLFPDARRVSDDSLMLDGDDDRMHAIMAVISEKKIPIMKIERIEPTLESLFMEVIG